ncbi:hypothetical protein KP004_05795 [Geomonas oryzisoli]|uniref:Uncharacterized protein n=1 Tax=Geomonas oryzisoli TaxID=2847992 RepID=A0ABX8J8C5_9BACT|nr:hypothetical protein [Geomonas oryzisoli]QWV94690.1 hypothetical protein KP004_05795 [Geomonas oryzisoli]
MNAKENFCREKTDQVLFAVIAHTFHSSRNRFASFLGGNAFGEEVVLALSGTICYELNALRE